MKATAGCLIGLVFSVAAGAEPLVEGRVLLPSGAPVPGAEVRLFDVSDLRTAPLATTTDGSGHFTLPLATLSGLLPAGFELGSNYPNPFNPSTIIPYQLPASMHARLEVFNLLGQRIATLVDGEQPAGFHTAVWDATDASGQAVGAGVYLYRLSGDGVQATRSMLLIDGQAGIPSSGGNGSTAMRGEGTFGKAGETAPVYGLTVSGPGLVPYVDPAFRVTSGNGPLQVVVEAPGSASSAKLASSGRILGDVDNTGWVDFFDALLVALYSQDASVVMPNNGDISLGDVNADGQVDLSDAWAIAAWLNDPSGPALPSGIGEAVGPAASLSPDPSTVSFADDGAWHRFTVEAGEPVTVVVNPGADTPRLEITTRSGRRNYCPAEADDDVSRQDGQVVYLSGCAEGTATVELRRESDGTVLRTYALEVTGSPADLIVESVSVSDGTLTPGQSFTLSATVRNQGTGQSAATTLRYYRSSNRTISTRDTQVGTDQVGALGASRTSAESIRLTAPSSEGTYYYGACVESVPNEAETGNNCSRGRALTVSAATEGIGTGDDEVTGGHGDLIIQSFEVSSDLLTAGQDFRFDTVVRNRGDETRSSWLYYYRSTDETIDTTDVFVRNMVGAVSDLPPSATQTVSLDWKAPPYAGTYYYGVCTKPLQWKGGHCSTGVRVTVEGSEAGSPDLTVSYVTVSHERVSPGSEITLYAEVENRGTGPAAATSMRWYLSTDATIDATDERLALPEGTHGLFSLKPLQGRWTHWLQAPNEEGTYYYGLCLRPTIGETHTDNNCSVGVPVVVEDSGDPDLTVVGLSTFVHKPATGEFLLWATVQNIGTGAARPSPYRFFRSDDATIDATDTEVRFWSNASFTLGPEAILGAGSPVGDPDSYPHFSETAPTSPGTYYYGACVGPAPGESDTSNNCSEAMPMNVGVPDLAIGRAWTSTSVPLAGQSFTLTAKVRNQGPEAAGSTTLRYYRSDDPTIDATDTPIGTDGVSRLTGFDGLVSGPGSRLAASGTSRESISVSAPATPGTYYYGACVDGVPGEANTDNNCSTGAYVRVGPSGEDPFNIQLVFHGDFTDARKDVMQQAARRWETIITEGLPEVDFSVNSFDFVDEDGRVTLRINDTVDDLRILVYKDDLGGPVGHGGPNYVRSGNPTGLPALGHISVDSGFLASLPQREPLWLEERLLRDLMIHEIAHVLGFGPLWTVSGLRRGPGTNPYFGGELAIEAFNAAGGRDYRGNKVPLEFGREGGGSACGESSHWQPHVFGSSREHGVEIMGPYMEREHRLSAITLQSLADLGYVVDVSRADPYRLSALVSTIVPRTASAKLVASYGDFDPGALGTIYAGDEQGRISHTITRD